MRIAILASGRGSNFQALLDAVRSGRLAVTIAGLFSDRGGAPVLARARSAGIRAEAIEPAGYASRAAHDESLFSRVASVQPDLIVCAGYMRLIGAEPVHRWQGRIINIHPSLLPRHPGLHTHTRAIEAGDRVHGASVHYVVPAVDAGPVIAQARVAVSPGQGTAALAAQVLQREHPLLVASVGLLAQRRLSLDHGRVVFDGRPLRAPLQLDDNEELTPDDADDRLPDHAP